MAHETASLLAALFDLASAIHDCRNSATWLPNEKIQLGVAFDKLTTRSTLIKLHEAYVDARPDGDRAAASSQVVKACTLLTHAQRKSERREALAETFEALDLLDVLLPPAAAPFLA